MTLCHGTEVRTFGDFVSLNNTAALTKAAQGDTRPDLSPHFALPRVFCTTLLLCAQRNPCKPQGSQEEDAPVECRHTRCSGTFSWKKQFEEPRYQRLLWDIIPGRSLTCHDDLPSGLRWGSSYIAAEQIEVQSCWEEKHILIVLQYPLCAEHRNTATNSHHHPASLEPLNDCLSWRSSFENPVLLLLWTLFVDVFVGEGRSLVSSVGFVRTEESLTSLCMSKFEITTTDSESWKFDRHLIFHFDSRSSPSGSFVFPSIRKKSRHWWLQICKFPRQKSLLLRELCLYQSSAFPYHVLTLCTPCKTFWVK